MILSRRTYLRLLCAGIAGTPLPSFAAETNFSTYSDQEKENFLRLAKILSVKEIGHGVTKPLRVEMALGEIR